MELRNISALKNPLSSEFSSDLNGVSRIHAQGKTKKCHPPLRDGGTPRAKSASGTNLTVDPNLRQPRGVRVDERRTHPREDVLLTTRTYVMRCGGAVVPLCKVQQFFCKVAHVGTARDPLHLPNLPSFIIAKCVSKSKCVASSKPLSALVKEQKERVKLHAPLSSPFFCFAWSRSIKILILSLGRYIFFPTL